MDKKTIISSELSKLGLLPQKTLLEDDSDNFKNLNSLIQNNFASYGSYKECTLELLLKESEINSLRLLLSSISDIELESIWCESLFSESSPLKDGLNTRISYLPQGSLKFRQFLWPDSIRNTCTLKQMMKSTSNYAKNTKTRTHRVTEAKCEPSMANILGLMGFHKDAEFYCKSHIYHNKYGNRSHVMTQINFHFKDKYLSTPISDGVALLRISGQFTNDNLYEFVQSNIVAYASNLKGALSSDTLANLTSLLNS